MNSSRICNSTNIKINGDGSGSSVGSVDGHNGNSSVELLTDCNKIHFPLFTYNIT